MPECNFVHKKNKSHCLISPIYLTNKEKNPKRKRKRKKDSGIYNCRMEVFPIVLLFSNRFIHLLHPICTIYFPKETNTKCYPLDFTLGQSTVRYLQRKRTKYVIQSLSWKLTLTPPPFFSLNQSSSLWKNIKTAARDWN